MKNKLSKIVYFLLITCFALGLFSCGGADVHTLKFDADGGTLSYYSQKLSTGDKIKLPAITSAKEGYNFSCFTYGYAGETYVISDGDSYLFRTGITVKAVWVPDDAYVITYYTDGGVFGNADIPFYYYGEQSVTLARPEKRGYRFLGFKEGNADPVTEIPAGTSGDKNFTAVFMQAEYDVHLNLTCEARRAFKENATETITCKYHGESDVTLKVGYGCALEIGKASPQNAEFDFLCWIYYKNGVAERFVPQGEQGALVFNENNFIYGETVELYVYCVPVISEFV